MSGFSQMVETLRGSIVLTVKRSIGCILLTVFITHFFCTPSSAAGGWVGVRSKNFLILGHLSESELRSLAASLEEFRAVFSQLLPEEYFDSRAATVVLIFADDDEYAPFKPLHQGRPDPLVAGYFKSGPVLDYITLSAGGTRQEITSVLFHEYVHLLIRSGYERAPTWLDEGYAEYYSDFDLIGGKRRVRVGKRLHSRAQYLRTHQLLPLKTLLIADRQSPVYHDHDQRGIFYAQSWALIHYLESDRTGARRQQLAAFLSLLAGGTAVEESVRRAFRIEFAALERTLREYARSAQFLEHVRALPEQLGAAPPAAAFPLSEARTQVYLGDLLLRTDRPDEARAYLLRALRIDPDLAAAHITLGILNQLQGRVAESSENLRKAIALDPQDHLAHYYYADLLRREGSELENTPAGYAEKTSLIRSELIKAIELAPNFLDAQGLLVLVDIERYPRLDEATDLLKHIMAMAPRRREFKLLSAQLHLRKEEFSKSREVLHTLVGDPSTNPLVRIQAQTMLDSVAAKEKIASERMQQDEEMLKEAADRAVIQPCDMPEPGPQRKTMRFAGQQACGRLLRIECHESGVVFFIDAGGRTLKLRSDAVNRVRFVTYTSQTRGRIECGNLANAQLVLVTYRPAQEVPSIVDGELTAVEFVPEDWLR